MNICIYGASSDIIDNSFLSEGEKLGKALAYGGHKIVYGGGKFGMMGAVSRSAKSGGGYVIGIAPSFFKVDGVLYDGCDQMIHTETMRERKQLLEEMSDAFIVTPGSIGTFDEFFEILSLKQLDRHNKPIVLYNINGYFSPIIEMLKTAVNQKFMKKENLDLIFVTDNPDDALKYLNNYQPDTSGISYYR